MTEVDELCDVSSGRSSAELESMSSRADEELSRETAANSLIFRSALSFYLVSYMAK